MISYSLKGHCERCQKQGVCRCGCSKCSSARKAAREARKESK